MKSCELLVLKDSFESSSRYSKSEGLFPKPVIKTIVRIRTNDGSEFLYTKGRVTGFDVVGDLVSQKCNEP